MKAISELNESIRQARQELAGAQAEKPYSKEYVARIKEELSLYIDQRVNFWRDTFRADGFDNKSITIPNSVTTIGEFDRHHHTQQHHAHREQRIRQLL